MDNEDKTKNDQEKKGTILLFAKKRSERVNERERERGGGFAVARNIWQQSRSCILKTLDRERDQKYDAEEKK